MSEYYLLSYKSVPLGIYNKLSYLLDYILELIRFPDKNVNLFNIEINLFNVNIAYPSSTLIFKENINNKRIYFEELNGKRVEMSDETFTRFKKIQNHFMKNKENTENTKKNKNIKLIENKKEEIKEIKEKKIVTQQELDEIEKELDEIEKKTEEIKEEQKDNIHKMNRMKRHMKVLANWQNKFIEDLKLYENFIEKQKENDKFIIPEMFEETFNFLKDFENPNEQFTEYFMKFNKDSNLDMDEIINLLNEIESDSNSESSDSEKSDSEKSN